MNNSYKMNYDVAVIGGEISGVFAAISSAFTGAKTVLVERNEFLGGIASTGEVISGLAHKIKNPIVNEFFEILLELDGVNKINADKTDSIIVNGEILKAALLHMCTKYGVDVIFDCDIVSVRKNSARIEQLDLYGKCNYITILAKVFIDTTTSCDLCKQAGIPVISILSDEKECLLPFSVTSVDPKVFIQYNSTNDCFLDKQFADRIPGSTWCGELLNLDCEHKTKCRITNMLETERMLIQVPFRFDNQETHSDIVSHISIKFIQVFSELKKIRGFEKVKISSISPFVIDKSIKMIQCVERATLRDLDDNMKDDAAIFVNNPINKKDQWFSVKSCISSDIENLVVAGTNIDTSINSYMVTSSIGGCISSGMASGCCAALAVIEGIAIESVDSKSIREKLYSM